MHVRLGDLLVARGVITEAQRQRILAAQAHSARPFGVIAERMFAVDPRGIEQAWAAQYATLAEHVDPRELWPSPDVLQLIDRRQAWQFRVMPLRYEQGELIVCTAEPFLARALRFVGWRITCPCSFVIASPEDLGEALSKWYAIAGLGAETLAS